MEEVLKAKQVAISKWDQLTQQLLEKAQEAHAEADKCVSTYTRPQEDLERHFPMGAGSSEAGAGAIGERRGDHR
jgi:hypothetical protein